MQLFLITLIFSFNLTLGMQLIIPKQDNSAREENSSSPKRMLTVALRTSKNALSRMLLSGSPRRQNDNDSETSCEEENSSPEIQHEEYIRKKEKFAPLFEPKEKTKARIEQIVKCYENREPPWTYNEVAFYIHCIKNAKTGTRQYFLHWPAHTGLDDLDTDCSSIRLHQQHTDPRYQSKLRKFLNLK